jgi:NAD(P)-dependent dehydrogenase (short-subunit alcohol dehydrogenase family)
MREAGDGTVVNVSSVAERLTAPGTGPYSASKHALGAMTDALRLELAPHGVDVVSVLPGPVETDFRDRVGEELDGYDRTEAYDDVYAFQEDASLLGGDGPFGIPPERVADVVLEAAVSPAPDPRYAVGEFARYALLTRHLPDGLRDAAFGLLRKLPS